MGVTFLLTQLKRLGGDSLLYALMNVGTKLIAFLMLPIYTAYLGTTQMGVLDNVDALTSILTFIIIFGTDNALAYYYYDTDSIERKEKFVSTVLAFRLCIALLLLFIFLIAGKWVSLLVTGSGDYAYLFRLSGYVLVLEAALTVLLTYYRFEFKSLKVMVYTVLKLAAVAVLTYAFLRFANLNVESVFYGRIIATFCILLVTFRLFIKFFRFKIDRKMLKEIISYGAPLVPASIAFWVITYANRLFLTHFDSLDAVGIYAVAAKFAMVIALLTSSIQMAWRPYTMSLKDKPGAEKVFSKIYILILIIGMTGLIGIATVTPFILDFMIPNPKFDTATKYVAIISTSTFLSFYYLIISVGLFFKKETKIISKWVGIGALLSLVLNAILIPLFSIWGASIALVLSLLFVTVMIFKKSQETYYVPVSGWKLLWIFLNGLVAMLAIVYIYEYAHLSLWTIVLPWFYYLITFVPIRIWKDLKS